MLRDVCPASLLWNVTVIDPQDQTGRFVTRLPTSHGMLSSGSLSVSETFANGFGLSENDAFGHGSDNVIVQRAVFETVPTVPVIWN